MKKYIYTGMVVLMLSGIAFAEVNWQLLSSANSKKLYIADYFDNNLKTSRIILNKEGTEISTYILKITQNDKSFTCSVGSYCPLSKEEEGTIAVQSIKNNNDYYSAIESEKDLVFKKPEGTIKVAHKYVCEQYYKSLIKYDTYLETAKKYESENDFKNALNSYKLAHQEAVSLVSKGYSENRVAETLISMAELCKKNEKPSLARGYYQEVANLTNLRNTEYKEKAIAKANSIPVTKGEKAKEIGSGVMYGVGAVGAGALKILLNSNY